MRIITGWLEELLSTALMFELPSWLYMQGTERFQVLLGWWSRFFSLAPPRKTCCLVAVCGKYLQNPPAALVGEQTAQRRGEIPVGFMAFWRVWRGMAAVPPPEGKMQQKSNLFLPTGNLFGGSVVQTVSVGTHLHVGATSPTV